MCIEYIVCFLFLSVQISISCGGVTPNSLTAGLFSWAHTTDCYTFHKALLFRQSHSPETHWKTVFPLGLLFSNIQCFLNRRSYCLMSLRWNLKACWLLNRRTLTVYSFVINSLYIFLLNEKSWEEPLTYYFPNCWN